MGTIRYDVDRKFSALSSAIKRMRKYIDEAGSFEQAMDKLREYFDKEKDTFTKELAEYLVKQILYENDRLDDRFYEETW
jgi:hypothetical protein